MEQLREDEDMEQYWTYLEGLTEEIPAKRGSMTFKTQLRDIAARLRNGESPTATIPDKMFELTQLTNIPSEYEFFFRGMARDPSDC